jgi:hypothetical protein
MTPDTTDAELRKKLRDIVSQCSTGYSYDELLAVIQRGDDLLDEDEIENVDATVNQLGHLINSHTDAVLERVETFTEEAKFRTTNDSWHAAYNSAMNDVQAALATIKEEAGDANT